MMNSRKRRQRGYVMVLLAMLLFGLMAMAALVIDLGFARLTQRQLQLASDTAALEGLRGTGLVTVNYGDRQDAAELLIDWTFDDNLDLEAEDSNSNTPTASYGAGPIVTFSGGWGDPNLQASQQLTVDLNNPVYKPNVLRGDEASGRFQVELQRGTENEQADLFCHGPAVPYLFARGSFLNRELISQGISVAGNSRAEARPAVRVGPMHGTTLGIVAIAYALPDWGPTPANAMTITSNISSGLSIGESLTIGDSTTPTTPGYCAIYAPETFRVLGFGLIGQAGQTVPLEGVVAFRNATASPGAAREALLGLSASDSHAVLSANAALQYALNAPVLVRN